MNYAFFGSAQFSVYVLDELEKAGMPPAIIITTPDKPAGRGLAITPNPVKVWGQKRNIPVLDPLKLDADFVKKLAAGVSDTASGMASGAASAQKCDTFIVAAYGKIIPQAVLDIPKHKTLNIHPSLLPLYRGASPLQSAMLDDSKKTGITIMRIDELMDHGPIVAQENITVEEWPTYEIFEENMARAGGKLLAKIMPDWIAGRIFEAAQDHSAATLTRKFTKEDALINFADDPYSNFRKIQAYHQRPTAYFFAERKNADGLTQKIRVKITKAHWDATTKKLIIEKVIPEGKGETDAKPYLPTLQL